eukprot:2848214-Prymnesium_polylepis.1
MCIRDRHMCDALVAGGPWAAPQRALQVGPAGGDRTGITLQKHAAVDHVKQRFAKFHDVAISCRRGTPSWLRV